jgi:hypothetical protein
MACGPREEVLTRCNATLHDPGYGTKRCLNVDWDRMANTLCFHRDRVFGHYGDQLPEPDIGPVSPLPRCRFHGRVLIGPIEKKAASP